MQIDNHRDSHAQLLGEFEYGNMVQNAKQIFSVLSPGPPGFNDGSGEEKLPRLFGNHELVARLGQGGMGRVYLANHLDSDRLVALKIIRPDYVNDWRMTNRQVIRRFRNEARTAANINHDNIITVFEVGEVEGQHYYSMQYVQGETLADAMTRSPLSNREAATCLKAIAEGVHQAHESDVLHRDIKPENIMIDVNGRPYIMDFGLAKSTSESVEQFTKTGTILGTVSYMSPEQAKNPATVTVASDVYSLGAVLYAALTGKPPFIAATAVETLRQLEDLDPIPPRKINAAVAKDLDTICLKCLDKDRSRRYSSSQGLADDLARWLNGEVIHAKPAGPIYRTFKWTLRNKSLAVLLLVAILILPIGLVASSKVKANQTRSRIQGMVNSLPKIEIENLPSVSNSIFEHGETGKSILFSSPIDVDSFAQNRTVLARLRFDDSQMDYIIDHLDRFEARDLPVVREMATHHSHKLDSLFDGMVTQERFDELNLVCLLANHSSHEQVWKSASTEIVRQLVQKDPADLAIWIDLLYPIRSHLLQPLKLRFTEARAGSEKLICTSVLCEFAKDNIDELLQVLDTADATELKLVVDKLANFRDQARPELASRIEKLSDSEPNIEGSIKVAANAATANILIYDDEDAWNVLGPNANQELRFRVTGHLYPARTRFIDVLNRVRNEQDWGKLYSLVSSLGDFPIDEQNSETSTAAIDLISRLFTEHPCSAVHSAAEWTLRQWGREATIESVHNTHSPENSPTNQWFVTLHGHVMTKCLEPAETATMESRSNEFVMGSPKNEPDRRPGESQIAVELAPFAIATKEVTVEQFSRFIPDNKHDSVVGPNQYCPVNHVSFNDAAAYCNYLSEVCGIPKDQWSYLISEEGIAKQAEGFLHKTGYRMPTEAEWEYAARAGIRSSRFFGDSDYCLSDFAWNIRNAKERSWPVGSLKPNEFGMFDVYGNSNEWCHSLRNDTNEGQQCLRGSAFLFAESHMRSAQRYVAHTTWISSTCGFRVARTLPD